MAEDTSVVCTSLNSGASCSANVWRREWQDHRVSHDTFTLHARSSNDALRETEWKATNQQESERTGYFAVTSADVQEATERAGLARAGTWRSRARRRRG